MFCQSREGNFFSLGELLKEVAGIHLFYELFSSDFPAHVLPLVVNLLLPPTERHDLRDRR